MQRHILKALIQWKDRTDRLPLLLRGARQVGKTYIIEHFGKTYFNDLVTINLELQPALKSCFNTLQPAQIIQAIEIELQQSIEAGKTLLFIDEIQECPAAIQALRYFKEQYPELHVIAAGSLLEFALNDAEFSLPVGRIEFLFLYPLSFSEFLWALGDQKLHEYLSHLQLTDTIPESIHLKALERLKLYLLLGGMPAVVQSYIDNHDLLRCQQLQAFVLNTYRGDFGKYAHIVNPQYCQRVFEKAPNLVAKKFKYIDVDPAIQSRELKKAVTALRLAGVIQPVYLSKATGLPLNASIHEKDFKLLFLDVGLVKYASRIDANILLSEDVLLVNHGAIAEQFVGQELIAHQPSFDQAELFYWHKEQNKGSAEVDYIIQHKNHIIPLEVKAGKTGRLKSLQIFMQEKNSPMGIKISQDNFGYEHNILSLPLYMIAELSRLLG
ncbi:MAG: ATP-binding protein [Gammaproteobacteria bacterium]